MTDDTERSQRLAREASFQDGRVEQGARGAAEARARYYFLAATAKQHYQDLLGEVRGRRVLVVGCSQGGVTPLARRGAKVTGVDISPRAIELLSAAIESEGLADCASARVMNAEDLEFSPSSFDLICCSGVLHHLDIDRAIASWASVLAPDGRVVMIEPMAWSPVVALYRLLTPSMRTADEHPLKPVDIRRLRSRFSRVGVHGYVLTSILSAAWSFLPGLTSVQEGTRRWLEAVDARLLRWFPALAYVCWTVVIELAEPRDDPRDRGADPAGGSVARRPT